MMDSEGQKKKQFYKVLLEQSATLFLVLNRDGRIQQANTYAKKELGDHIEGRAFKEILLDFHHTFDLSQIKKTANVSHLLNIKRKSGLPETYLFRFEHFDGSIYAFGELDHDELESTRKQILLLNADLNNLTRELHKKNAELEMLNREKNQFLGMAAHDLRKPIGLILSYSDFLIDEAAPSLDSEHVGFLDTIQKSCLFMKRLVDDFLDVSAIEAGKFDLDLDTGNMSEVLSHSLELNMLQASKNGIKLVVDAEPDLPRIFIDSSKIEQVITNLVSNAIEHSDTDTRVVIRLVADREKIRFSVEDQGPGIPADEMEKLFRPYEKTSVKKKGGEKSTGLGMLITRKIIEAHGGEIWVDSVFGRGTTIFFTLPLTREET